MQRARILHGSASSALQTKCFSRALWKAAQSLGRVARLSTVQTQLLMPCVQLGLGGGSPSLSAWPWGQRGT